MHRGPVLAGNQECIPLWEVGYPVQHVIVPVRLVLGQNRGVYGRLDLASGLVDSDDRIAAPHVRIHRLTDALELVEQVHLDALISYGECCFNGEVGWVPKSQI